MTDHHWNNPNPNNQRNQRDPSSSQDNKALSEMSQEQLMRIYKQNESQIQQNQQIISNLEQRLNQLSKQKGQSPAALFPFFSKANDNTSKPPNSEETSNQLQQEECFIHKF